MLSRSILSALIILCCSVTAQTQLPAAKPPHVLVVIAHPDDESILAVTLYKIVREQHGSVDLFVVTNGEAGYRYSTLAETYYRCPLTNEADGRRRLPAIRRRELKRAGKVLGISHFYFAGQRDDKYCLDEREPLDSCWDVPAVRRRLQKQLNRGHYDYVFCLLPDSSEHGAHKAATLLAIDAVASLPASSRPVVLGAHMRNKTDSAIHFSGLLTYGSTRPVTDTALFKVDRTASFSYNNRLNYKVIANWELAEHKSQGATQMTMNDGDLEEFWYFTQDSPAGIDRSRGLFIALQTSPYQTARIGVQ